jgi:autotransporter adhesin
MKRFALLAACCAALGTGLSPARAASITVSSNPLWTDTGITLTAQSAVTIHGASGSWNFGGAPCGDFGPDGCYVDWLAWDEWIINGYHGQLIGFVGDNPYSASQNDSRLFTIGTTTVTVSGVGGKLWLGFNDAYVSGIFYDNTGSVTVQVDSTYQIRLLYDSSKAAKAGSIIPIKIQVLDYNGDNRSSSLTVHAFDVVKVSDSASTAVVDAGNANPDFDFRYDAALAGYIFNLKTTGLGTGTYRLYFTVGGSAVHFATFEVR